MSATLLQGYGQCETGSGDGGVREVVLCAGLIHTWQRSSWPALTLRYRANYYREPVMNCNEIRPNADSQLSAATSWDARRICVPFDCAVQTGYHPCQMQPLSASTVLSTSRRSSFRYLTLLYSHTYFSTPPPVIHAFERHGFQCVSSIGAGQYG